MSDDPFDFQFLSDISHLGYTVDAEAIAAMEAQYIADGILTPEEIAASRFPSTDLMWSSPQSIDDEIQKMQDDITRRVMETLMMPAELVGQDLNRAAALTGTARSETDADLRARLRYVTGFETCAAGAELDAVACRAGLRRR